MRLLKILGVIVAAIVLAKIFVFPDYRHRFRLTIEFDTPDGVKSASGVHEVVRKDVRWILIAQGRFEYRFRGEAIFLDLGRGKHVIALLAHGQFGQEIGGMTILGVDAYTTGRLLPEDRWVPKPPFSGIRELPAHRVPTMAVFSNPQDPKTVRVIDPSDRRITEEAIGVGYAFRRATIEAVAAGVWPLNAYGITGVAISTGIEQRLHWVEDLDAGRRKGVADIYPGRFTLNGSYFRR